MLKTQHIRKAPEPICDHEPGKLICIRCQRKIDRRAAELAMQTEIGRQIMRRLTMYGNMPRGPEITE